MLVALATLPDPLPRTVIWCPGNQAIIGGAWTEEEDRVVSALRSRFTALGARPRLVLALLVYQRPNLLLLDEPTNHLDLESIEALNNGMAEFKGFVIFTSHDHQFMQTIANRVIEITPNGVIDRLMSYDEYILDPKVKELQAQMYPKEVLV